MIDKSALLILLPVFVLLYYHIIILLSINTFVKKVLIK